MDTHMAATTIMVTVMAKRRSALDRPIYDGVNSRRWSRW
jgi:hypothetical protein